jgi:hypothetical protein
MTVGTGSLCYSGDYVFQDLPRNARPQRLLGGAALACIALACAWTMSVSLFGGNDLTEVSGTRGDKLDLAAGRGDKLIALRREAAPVANAIVAWFDPHSLHAAPGSFAARAPLQANWQPAVQEAQRNPDGDHLAQSAPSHAPAPQSPQIHAASSRDRKYADRVVDKPADTPTLFEKLFGSPAPLTLAYAAPNDGLGGVTGGLYDRETAVYDISARVVYMPDGSRLEAHSGLGGLLDDPRHPEERNRGVTPPNIYDLEPREELFHGVRALRLIPEDESKVYGRSGFLAHTFMLGPNGDSNGCVSFRNYEKFLQAYLERKIKRLAVVAHL